MGKSAILHLLERQARLPVLYLVSIFSYLKCVSFHFLIYRIHVMYVLIVQLSDFLHMLRESVKHGG